MYLKHGVIIITGVTLPCTPLPCPSHRARITSPQGVHTWPKAVHSCATLLHLLPLPPLPRPSRLGRFAGVCVEGVEGLGLFPLNWRGVSAGFCGCFGEPAASAFTSAGAAASPGQLTILRIAVSSSLNTSVYFHAAHRFNKLLQPTMRRTPRVGRGWGPEQGQAHAHCRKLIQYILAGHACHICCF